MARLNVTSAPQDGGAHRGRLRAGRTVFPCVFGRGGLRADKREGDGATPVGTFPLRWLAYRPDRVSSLRTLLPARPLRPADRWCDDPDHSAYNRLVTGPLAAGHERLWRADGLYDLLVVLGYNDDPVVAGRGSAIFLHVAGAGWPPTEGCVALAREDLLEVVAGCGAGDMMSIGQAESR